MRKTRIFAVLAAMAMRLAVFGCSNGDSSSESVRDFGKGTYTLDGTFENGTIHLHQTHTSSTSGWVGKVEDKTLTVEDGKFTVNIGEIITFTKVGSSSHLVAAAVLKAAVPVVQHPEVVQRAVLPESPQPVLPRRPLWLPPCSQRQLALACAGIVSKKINKNYNNFRL